MQRFLALAIEVRKKVKGPSSLCPRNLSLGSKSENHRGGIIHVSVMMCGTLSSTVSELIAIDSSTLDGTKKLATLNGIDSLKVVSATQHRAAVDHGDA